jgi:hypothetical protein
METDIAAVGAPQTQTEKHEFKEPTETLEAQNDSDANSLTQVVSGPPYSIFSDKTKGFIVFMGKQAMNINSTARIGSRSYQDLPLHARSVHIGILPDESPWVATISWYSETLYMLVLI